MSGAPFTAVVVIHDSAAELERLLDSIARHLDPAPQLVIVDTDSTDSGPVLARARGADVIELGANPGFGPASNEGVGRAATDVTVLLNPDVELLDDGLAVLAGRARDHAALLAPRLLNRDGSTQRSAHPPPGRVEALLPALVHPPFLPRGLRLRAEPWRSDEPRRVGWAVAACLAAGTGTLRRLGPFDPGAFLFYEDLDLCLRAGRLGIPTELHPDIRVGHAGAHSTGPTFGGEPHDLIARRRREVVGALGGRALALDDAAQGLTFATRIAARVAMRRGSSRERDQLRALRRARRPQR